MNVAIRKDIDFIDGSLKSTEIAMQEKKRISITCSRYEGGEGKLQILADSMDGKSIEHAWKV